MRGTNISLISIEKNSIACIFYQVPQLIGSIHEICIFDIDQTG